MLIRRYMMAALLIAVALVGCSERELRDAVERIEQTYEQRPLSRKEVVRGLKEALDQGIATAAGQASREGGYYDDERLKIPFPPEIAELERALRKLGLDDEVDRFVRRLNRGAELAAAQAEPIFFDAIGALTIGDAFDILKGPPDAATKYLKSTSYDALYAAFRPVVRDKLQESRAVRTYDLIVSRFDQFPLVEDVSLDLDDYATRAAIDGLFVLVADEEARIRAEPVARTTELLKRVFGSLD